MKKLLNCPECGGEVKGIKLKYYCAKDHLWEETVDRADHILTQEEKPKASTLNVTVHGRELNLQEPVRKKMPFGKYGPQKGDHRALEDIPVDYFVWCLENMDHISPELREEMENQIELKKGRGVAR